MKIRKVIGILVCLGIVAFASTASAFSLNELIYRTEFDFTMACDNPREITTVSDLPGYFSMLCDNPGATTNNVHGVNMNYETGEVIADYTLENGVLRAATTSGDNLVVLGIRYAEPVIWTVSPAGEVLSEIEFVVPGLNWGLAVDVTTVDGNYYVVGNGSNPTTGSTDVFFANCSPDGICSVTLFETTGFNELARQIDAAVDGSLIITSTSSNPDANTNITKVHPDGGVIWTIVIDQLPSYTDQYGGTYYDKSNDKLFSVTQYVAPDTGKRLIYLRKLNADGTTDTENTIGADLVNSYRIDFGKWAPAGAKLYLGGVESIPPYYARGAVLKINPELQLEAIITDDLNVFFQEIDTPDATQFEAYGGELAFVVAGTYSQTGVKLFCLTDDTCLKVDMSQPMDYHVNFLSPDGLVGYMFADYTPELGGAVLRAFSPDLGTKPKKHERHIPPGIMVPAVFDPADTGFDEYLEALFGEVTLEGDMTIELVDLDSEIPPLDLPAGVEPISAVYRIEVDADYTNARLTIICGATGIENGKDIVALKSEVTNAVQGWIPPGIRKMGAPPDEITPTAFYVEFLAASNEFRITVDIPQFSDWVVVYMPDAVSKLEELIQTISEWNLQKGISNALDSKMANALAALQAENADQRQDAINKLEALISSAEAQRGGWLTDDQADYIINWTSAIIAAYSI